MEPLRGILHADDHTETITIKLRKRSDNGMAEWNGPKRTLNSIPVEDDPTVDVETDHAPLPPEAPGAVVSPQRPGATPDKADLPGRTRGHFDRLISTRRPLTEYGSAQRLLGLYTPAPGEQMSPGDWEQGPSSFQELRKLNPANLTPRRPLSGYGLGIGRTAPSLPSPGPEMVEAIPVESENPVQPAAQVVVAAPANASAPAETAPVPAGALHSGGQVDCPPEFPIKGNAQSKIYHTPQSRVYAQTIAEFCFASVEAAEAAGFHAPRH
jgi:hypothetical protein